MSDASPTPWLSGFIYNKMPTGYPTSFGSLRLDGSWSVQRNGGGPATFGVVQITPYRTPVRGAGAQPANFQLSGGRVYRAYPDSARSPISWVSWTCEFLVVGDSDAVSAYINEFGAREGFAYNLHWSGADSLLDNQYSQFYQKECKAEMIGVNAMMEYTMKTPTPVNGPTTTHKTHIILQATFQQLSDFTVVS